MQISLPRLMLGQKIFLKHTSIALNNIAWDKFLSPRD